MRGGRRLGDGERSIRYSDVDVAVMEELEDGEAFCETGVLN